MISLINWNRSSKKSCPKKQLQSISLVMMIIKRLPQLVNKLRNQQVTNVKVLKENRPLLTSNNKNPKKVKVLTHPRIPKIPRINSVMMIHGKFFLIDMMNSPRPKFAGGM